MLEFRKENKYGKLAYGEYDVYLNNKRVAQIRTPLFYSRDKLMIYYKDNDGYTSINTTYLTQNEALKKATNVIRKKLYKEAVTILESINTQPIIMK